MRTIRTLELWSVRKPAEAIFQCVFGPQYSLNHSSSMETLYHVVHLVVLFQILTNWIFTVFDV
jgi:hypothetical protein